MRNVILYNGRKARYLLVPLFSTNSLVIRPIQILLEFELLSARQITVRADSNRERPVGNRTLTRSRQVRSRFVTSTARRVSDRLHAPRFARVIRPADRVPFIPIGTRRDGVSVRTWRNTGDSPHKHTRRPVTVALSFQRYDATARADENGGYFDIDDRETFALTRTRRIRSRGCSLFN